MSSTAAFGDPDGDSVVLGVLVVLEVLVVLVVLEVLEAVVPKTLPIGLGTFGVFFTGTHSPLLSLTKPSSQRTLVVRETALCSNPDWLFGLGTGNANIIDKGNAKVMQIVRIFLVDMVASVQCHVNVETDSFRSFQVKLQTINVYKR